MGDEQIAIDDFRYLCEMLTYAFGEDYVTPDGMPHQKAKLVFSEAVERGYTKSDFRNTIKIFIANQVYPNWVPGAFFKADKSEKLYPEKWMIEQVNKYPEAKQYMEGYEFDIEGKKITMWRWTRSNKLPFKQIYPYKKPKLHILDMPTKPFTDEEMKNIDLAKELYKTSTILQKNKGELLQANKKIKDLELQLEIYRNQEIKNGYTIKEFNQLKEANSKNIDIIEQLQKLIKKMREYITESIKYKSVHEQITIWKQIMEDK
ncbi:hypothetical protein D9V86_07255 [Bacteroidetes/Chlorobi group bacterium ChocPot_Mid]|nr:MAG: hypothetical protein D9V86_07255 [Bacteroidetes/Chlorobi group bacterium ChocPot_Mid]